MSDATLVRLVQNTSPTRKRVVRPRIEQRSRFLSVKDWGVVQTNHSLALRARIVANSNYSPSQWESDGIVRLPLALRPPAAVDVNRLTGDVGRQITTQKQNRI